MKSETKKQAPTQWGSSFDGCATFATPIKGIDPCDRNSDSEHKDNPYHLMFEGLAEKDTEGAMKEIAFTHYIGLDSEEIHVADGFEFQDENGNTISARKVKIVKKKPKYPTSYKECCKVVNASQYAELVYDLCDGNNYSYDVANIRKYQNLRKLLICRDAYWKIAGDWKPSWDKCTGEKYCIAGFLNNLESDTYADRNYFTKTESEYYNRILAFPTEEMRDTFYENFKDLINECKELL